MWTLLVIAAAAPAAARPLAAAAAAAEALPRRVPGRGLENVTYLHIPKTGSTFENIVFRSACRWQTPPFIEAVTVSEFARSHCPQAFEHFTSGHRPLARAPAPRKVFITILRKPWKRVYSGLMHNFHDCRRLQRRVTIQENDMSRRAVAFFENLTNSDVAEYASCVGGCAVNMLVGRTCGAPAANGEVAWAVLAEFDFVGISDFWDLTLRLFSETFGVPVVKTDRLQLRSRTYSSPQKWIPAMLQKAHLVDNHLYDRAVARFLDDLERAAHGALDLGTARDDSIEKSREWTTDLIAPSMHGPGFITTFNGSEALVTYGHAQSSSSPPTTKKKQRRQPPSSRFKQRLRSRSSS